jgi:hypothetical protein
MVVTREGDSLLITDDVSGRVVRVPAVLAVGVENEYALRQLYTAFLFDPERFAGVTIVREGPHDMSPREMRATVPNYLWHPKVIHHPTGGGSDIDHAHETHRLGMIRRAKKGELATHEMFPPGSAKLHKSDDL